MRLMWIVRVTTTLVMLVIAVAVGLRLWDHYMYSPWTRDGRVKADIITGAADVSGRVVQVNVRDNQEVHRGDVLFVVDPEPYRIAVAQTQALVAARKAELVQKRHDAQRRAQLDDAVISSENREKAMTGADAAQAQYDEAVAQLDAANLNLERTQVRASVDGFVTNLNVHPGDYALAGRPVLAVIDENSFWVYGYFEETKLPALHPGDPVKIRLMTGQPELTGHIDSVSRGIADRENATNPELLANVNPTFSWVRLAQRVPVRVHIDQVPEGVALTVGMTCTVIVEPHTGVHAETTTRKLS